MTTEIDVTRLWQTGQLSDVQVQLRDRTFKAHKIMLCKHSSMFRRIIERNPATDKINLKLDEAAIFPDGEIFAVFLESIHTQRFDRDRGYSLLGNIIFALQAYQAGQKSGSPLLTGAAATNFKMLLFHSERDDFGNAATGDAFARFIQMVYNRSTITSACIHPARDECGLRKYFMEFYSPRMSMYLSRRQMDWLTRWIPDFAVDYTFSHRSQSWGAAPISSQAPTHACIFTRPSRCIHFGPFFIGLPSQCSDASDYSRDSGEDSDEA
ncbi:hypothetical protein HDK77DRAFT_484840 [Phyllosticta capitalensis]